MRWGEQLEFTAEAGPGDFIFVPSFVPHQEINASPDNPLCLCTTPGQEGLAARMLLVQGGRLERRSERPRNRGGSERARIVDLQHSR
jgi:hypothetical protein